MATREFEASHIHQRAVKAIEGLPIRIEERWVEICKDNYASQGRYYESLNTRLFTRWGWRKKVEQRPFDQYVQETKTEEDYWGYNQYDLLVARFNDDLYELRRLRNLAEANDLAGKNVRISDKDFQTIRFYEKYAP
ncbi:hypothetical protein [Xanthomonas phage BUDD]|nr:hypothetical protein [Xanthomonas phage BUDD]